MATVAGVATGAAAYAAVPGATGIVGPVILGAGLAGGAYGLNRLHKGATVIQQGMGKINERSFKDPWTGAALKAASYGISAWGGILNVATRGLMLGYEKVGAPALKKAQTAIINWDSEMETNNAFSESIFSNAPYTVVTLSYPPAVFDFSIYRSQLDAQGVEQNMIRENILETLRGSGDPYTELLKMVNTYVATNILQQGFRGDAAEFKVFMDLATGKDSTREKALLNGLIRNVFERFLQIFPMEEIEGKGVLPVVIYSGRAEQEIAHNFRSQMHLLVNHFVRNGRGFPLRSWVMRGPGNRNMQPVFDGSFISTEGESPQVQEMRQMVGLTEDGGDRLEVDQVMSPIRYFTEFIASPTLEHFLQQNPGLAQDLPERFHGEIINFLYELWLEYVDPANLLGRADGITANLAKGEVKPDSRAVIAAAETIKPEALSFPAAEFFSGSLAKSLSDFDTRLTKAQISASGDVTGMEQVLIVLGIDALARTEGNGLLRQAQQGDRAQYAVDNAQKILVAIEKLKKMMHGLHTEMQTSVFDQAVRRSGKEEFWRAQIAKRAEAFDQISAMAFAIVSEEAVKPLTPQAADMAKEFRRVITQMWARGPRNMANKSARWLYQNNRLDPGYLPRIDAFWESLPANPEEIRKLFVALTGFDIVAWNNRQLLRIANDVGEINNDLARGMRANQAIFREIATVAAAGRQARLPVWRPVLDGMEFRARVENLRRLAQNFAQIDTQGLDNVEVQRVRALIERLAAYLNPIYANLTAAAAADFPPLRIEIVAPAAPAQPAPQPGQQAQNPAQNPPPAQQAIVAPAPNAGVIQPLQPRQRIRPIQPPLPFDLVAPAPPVGAVLQPQPLISPIDPLPFDSTGNDPELQPPLNP